MLWIWIISTCWTLMWAFLSSPAAAGSLCCSSLRSDAQTLHTSMPIAWIPGRYGNRVAPTQISILSSLWSPWSPVFSGSWSVVGGDLFSASGGRGGRTRETKFWQQPRCAESTNQTTHSRPASTSSTHRPASPPPPALSSVSPRSFRPVLLKVCLPWQCCLWQHQVLMSCVCVCSGGDEGGGDREMSQWHQEAPRGDGVQKQQVTATKTLSLPDVTHQIHSGTVDVSMLTAANRLILLTVVELTRESQEACDWLKEERGGTSLRLKSFRFTRKKNCNY